MSNSASSDDNMRHMSFIDGVAAEDCAVLRVKEATYMGSWKRRGGVGAFMMLARKWDRLESILSSAWGYDAFKAIEQQTKIAVEQNLDPLGDGLVLAEIRDLRQYLLLVEAEMRARGVVKTEPEPENYEIMYRGPTSVSIPPGFSARITMFNSPHLEDLVQTAVSEPVVTDSAQASERRVPRFDYSYDVLLKHRKFHLHGNGANGMLPGDRVVYVLDERVGTALEFLQDGDASVRFDSDTSPTTVKWCNLIPADASESNRPGTPEDGGHHGSTTPWVCDDEFLLRSKIAGELVGKFWSQRGKWTFVLEPYVQNYHIPTSLRGCYNMRGESWTLRMDRVPPEIRDYFPSLPLEQNMKEWEELPEWQRVLYTWLDGDNKYRLAVKNHSWHVEADR